MTRAAKIWCGLCVTLPVGVVVFGLFSAQGTDQVTVPTLAPTPQDRANEIALEIEQNSHVVLIKGECFLLSYPEHQYTRSLTWMPCPPHFEPEYDVE
jgi:hypothetical protein